jgi:predicted DNA-binding transcriptional regulator YafY
MSNNIITQAIRERRKLQFTYHGKTRLVDPHVFGISTKNHEVILCWQTGGGSSKPNDLPNWRMFETHEIQNMQITNNNFIPQSRHHNPFHSDIRTTYAVI